MTVWVLFAALGLYGKGAATFQYEFKDKEQCISSLDNIKKHLGGRRPFTVYGYCQEVRK